MKLTYHCPRLRGDYLRAPCAAMIKAAEKERAVFPGAMLEFKDHCLECRGQELVRREGYKCAGGYAGDIRPELTSEIVTIPLEAQNPAPGSDKIAECAPLLEEIIESKLTSDPLFEKEVFMAQPESIRPEVARPAVADAPRCPRHPAELQVACAGTSKRAGQFLGVCKVCLAERKVRRKPKGTENMTPAVMRDLKNKKGKVSVAELNAAVVTSCEEKPALAPVAPVAPPDPGNLPLCTRHNRPIRFNRLGVSMGGCEECRREIAAMGGAKAKIQLAQNPIELIFAAYPEELAWLLESARDQVRTPEGQLIYLVRQAWEQGR